MVVRACSAPHTVPNARACPLKDTRYVQTSNNLAFAPTNKFSRLQLRLRQTIRTCLNATESSKQDQPHSPERLQHELQDAIRMENYKKAAELRDEMKSLEPQDSVSALKKKMDQFVAQDKFEVSRLACT